MRSVLIVLSLILSAATMGWCGSSVYYHGQVMTNGAITIGGKTYIPLSDVAKSLSGHVVSHQDGYEIVTSGGSGSSANGQVAGGANQVNGTKAKIGDWTFDGRWRLKVLTVEKMDSYTLHIGSMSYTDKPTHPDDQIVAVTCTIKNGTSGSSHPILATNGLGKQVTALADDQGQSYPPMDFDVRDVSLLPGAANTFTVVFSVPKTANLTDLVFSLYSYDDTKINNVRVSMAGV